MLRFDTPEFFPFNSFYTVGVGGQSCYGDQLIEVARHLVSSCNDTGGEGDSDDIDIVLTSPDSLNNLVGRFETAFGSQSAYGPWPVDPNYKPKVPIEGPWRHASIRAFCPIYPQESAVCRNVDLTMPRRMPLPNQSR